MAVDNATSGASEQDAQVHIERLEAKQREYLDWADENDTHGGHVGISRYYRRRAWEIGEEICRAR